MVAQGYIPRKHRGWYVVVVVLFLSPAVWLLHSALTDTDSTRAQTRATVAIGYLTILLITCTAFYAWTTHQTLRLLKEDFEVRYHIEVFVQLRHKGQPPNTPFTVDLELCNLSSVGIWVESAEVAAQDILDVSVGNQVPAVCSFHLGVVVARFDSEAVSFHDRLYEAYPDKAARSATVAGKYGVRIKYLALGVWRWSQCQEYYTELTSAGVNKLKRWDDFLKDNPGFSR